MIPEAANDHAPARHLWQALVQGKSFALDYSRHFLAIPDWFSAGDLDMARPYISAARSSLQFAAISRTTRLCLFKNDHFCTVGLTALSGDLSQEMTRDNQNREFYVFAGYVARVDRVLYPDAPHHPPIPSLAALQEASFTLFRPLYNHVRTQFHKAPAPGQCELSPILTAPEPWPTVVLDEPEEAPSMLELNTDEQQRLKIWPQLAEASLWAAACRAPTPVSLCLGIRTAKDALAGPFGNITLDGFKAERTLYRQTQAAVSLPTSPARNPAVFRLEIDFLGRSIINLIVKKPASQAR